jgi:hypothetical protein
MKNVGRETAIASGILLTGLLLMVVGGEPSFAAASHLQLATAFGGDCYFCDSDTDECGTEGQTTCVLLTDGPNAGKYSKRTGTGQPEAVCASSPTAGKEECDEDTPMQCVEEWICTGVDAGGNCTGCAGGSITVTVPTNCEMSGTCTEE